MDLAAYIRAVPDFPKPGILFRDITPLLADPGAWRWTIEQMRQHLAPLGVDYVVGMESRGFIFAAPVAASLNAGFIPVRKPGKLPRATYSQSYNLEYGTDSLELHRDCFAKAGAKVAVIDDVIATGGTAQATAQLVKQAGGELVAFCFLVELTFLEGSQNLPEVPLFSLVQY
jgi:adenine phosphoribosyltransferase